MDRHPVWTLPSPTSHQHFLSIFSFSFIPFSFLFFSFPGISKFSEKIHCLLSKTDPEVDDAKPSTYLRPRTSYPLDSPLTSSSSSPSFYSFAFFHSRAKYSSSTPSYSDFCHTLFTILPVFSEEEEKKGSLSSPQKWVLSRF